LKVNKKNLLKVNKKIDNKSKVKFFY